MAEAEATQRIAAILAADAAGYTRLMAADEAATIAALDQARAVFREQVADERGRIVDTAGDSVLAVFETTAGAVRAARAIQVRLEAINASRPEDRSMRFRIGVHLGDIHEKADGSVYGDGVNVAARLQALAEPGGIVVSDTVQSTLRSRADVAFASLGAHTVKNIAEPVHAFGVVAPGASARAAGDARHARRLLLAVVVSVAAITFLSILGLILWSRTVTDADAPASESEDAILAMPDGPVVAVLPFDNLSGDPDQEYFSDGLTEDLITGLSRFRDLLVVGRNTTFQYKGRAVDIRTVAQEVGARYVIEGSVRRSAETVRVTAQLIDAADGTHLWSDSYDRDLDAAALFAIQDEITAQIVGAIAGSYGAISRARLEVSDAAGTDNLEAYDCVLQAYAYEQLLTPDIHAEVRDCLERAVELDPSYADAWSKLAFMYADEYAFGYNTRPGALDRALQAAQRAVEIDPSSQMTHWHLARTHFWRNEVEEAVTEAERALSLNRNNAFVLAAAGVYMAFTSPENLERGVALTDKAMLIDPNPPGWYHVAHILSHYYNGDYDAALKSSLKMNIPGFYHTHMWRTAIYGQLGRSEDARASLARLLELYPNFAANARAELEKVNTFPALIDRIMDGWRKAGLIIPEEAS